MSAIQIRRAVSEDADRLSRLFQDCYRHSSHPCKDPATLRHSLESGDRWLIALDGDRVVGCTAGLWHPWNQVYETGRTVTHEDYRGERLGQRLVEQSYHELYEDASCALTVGYPRSSIMLRVAQKTAPTPFVVTGHDGGANVANGVRESHLIGLTNNRKLPTHRVAPTRDALGELAPVAESMVSALELDAEPGLYPQAMLTGPGAAHHCFIAGWHLGYRYDPECPSRSLEITEAVGPRHDVAGLAHAIGALLKLVPGLRHMQLTLLADKQELRSALQELGFRVSGYLPAWHLESDHRYDCITLAMRTEAHEPAALGTDSLIEDLDRELNPLQPLRRDLQRVA